MYTPQVMVGEKVRTQWHSNSSFARALANARAPATVGLALSLQREVGKLELRLGAARVEGRTATPATLWLAETVDGQTTDVRSGENGGVRLHHDRVVRKLWGPWPLGTAALSQRVQIPAGSASADFTAFVQDGQGKTLQSLRLPSTCRQ